MPGHRIVAVEHNSIAAELGIEAGDYLEAVDEKPVADILDYRFRTACRMLRVRFSSDCGQQMTADIEKGEDEDLGLEFEQPLLSPKRKCANRCIFCFVDQLPKDVRETLRFKDDDWRLSFLQGNFVTLTNVSDKELSRIIDQRISPINISVQTTDGALRSRMMNNKRAADINRQLAKLTKGEIDFYAQIVLCPGINDGQTLSDTLIDLAQYRPYAKGVAIVPVGLTAYRQGLEELRPVYKRDALDAIDRISAFADRFGQGFVQLADEFYLIAEQPIPPAEMYGDFAQLEDGVGMLRYLMDGFLQELQNCSLGNARELSIATGEAAYPTLRALCDQAETVLGMRVYVYPVRNLFFGGGVTVTGLLTGKCLKEGLKDKPLGEKLLLCSSMLRDAQSIFLDDTTVRQLSVDLDIEIQIVENDGAALVEALQMERN